MKRSFTFTPFLVMWHFCVLALRPIWELLASTGEKKQSIIVLGSATIIGLQWELACNDWFIFGGAFLCFFELLAIFVHRPSSLRYPTDWQSPPSILPRIGALFGYVLIVYIGIDNIFFEKILESFSSSGINESRSNNNRHNGRTPSIGNQNQSLGQRPMEPPVTDI
uniref:Uncharacterized protein n=1 Tax=Globodera rostochiensis TaxID=31243 RepID=A0A914HE21_GLORO